MRRSCHWFGSRGPNCTGKCPDDCIGDFTASLREILARLEESERAFLGFCDVHGTPITVRTARGRGLVSHMVPWEPAGEATMSLADWKRTVDARIGDPAPRGTCHCAHPARVQGACSGGCPPDCLGDFTEAARILAPKMRLRRAYVEDKPRRRPGKILLSWQAGKEWSLVDWLGRRTPLGVCELHGNVDLVGLFDGKLYVEETVTWPPDTWGP